MASHPASRNDRQSGRNSWMLLWSRPRKGSNTTKTRWPPIARVTGYDIIIPYFSREKWYMPSVQRIVAAARQTLVN